MDAVDQVGSTPQVSVVIPCHNERTRLPPTLAELRAYFEARPGRFEIIVVDNGSTDGTAEMATEFLQPLGLAGVVLASRQNAGKGAAVRRGMLAASGRIVLFTDADLSTPIGELRQSGVATRSPRRRRPSSPGGAARAGP
jgi:glycosyltransferase involved in cell wall biosynthesis